MILQSKPSVESFPSKFLSNGTDTIFYCFILSESNGRVNHFLLNRRPGANLPEAREAFCSSRVEYARIYHQLNETTINKMVEDEQ